MIEIKKILFPIDFTENSSKFPPYVVSICEKYNSMIYLLHVVQDFHSFGSDYIDDIPHDELDRFQKEVGEAAKMAMERVCKEQLEGCPNLQMRVMSGDPASEILKVIDSEGIDLVIMGTHGRKGLQQVIFGSVAENVVKKSLVPVLTINPYKLK
jgi:nucleotide-binding universal stress UspA family protein